MEMTHNQHYVNYKSKSCACADADRITGARIMSVFSTLCVRYINNPKVCVSPGRFPILIPSVITAPVLEKTIILGSDVGQAAISTPCLRRRRRRKVVRV